MVGIEKIPECKFRWNTNEEILQYLSYACLNPHLLKKKHIIRPNNGAILLFDRTKVRYKTDGYDWKKRKDGKNVREDHMKLKVNGVECLYGAYVHNEAVPNFHRRCYWKLKTPKVVLVHYLYVADEVQAGPPSITQFHNAISQLQNIFNVPEGATPRENGAPSPAPRTETTNSDDVNSTRASQLLLILRKQGHQLKQLIYQDNKSESILEDKDTQTERCNYDNSTDHKCCNGRRTCAMRSSTCTARSSTCTSPVPSSSRESERMETETAHHEELEACSLLVSKHNPLLSNSSSAVDDLTSFLDPILSSHNGMEGGGSDHKNDCDIYFNNPDILRYDLASLKDKDSKLFELFEEAEMASNQGSYGCPTPDIPLQTEPEPVIQTSAIETRGQDNIPVGQKRKYNNNNTNNNANNNNNNNSMGRMECASSPRLPNICDTEFTSLYTIPTQPVEPEPVLPTSEFRVQITTISPGWAYLCGGEKVVLVGDWENIQGRCCVLFGNTMVPAQHLRNGVIQVRCPAASFPGVVTVHIVSEGVIINNSQTKFTYREQHSPSQWLHVVDSNFKYSLINRLEALESQVRMFTTSQYSGDLQTRMCSISLPILQKLSRSMKLPRPPRGLRLIHLAAGVGYSRLVLLLLRFSSLLECNPSSLDDMGNNALVWACVGGHTPTIYILLRCCPRLRGSRDGWGRPIKDMYKASMGNLKGETAARTIQLHYRTYKQKKLNEAAIIIQSRFRTYKQQCTFEQMRRAVVIIQQSYRDHMKTKEVAAKTIQRCWRQTSRHKRVLLGLANNTPFC